MPTSDVMACGCPRSGHLEPCPYLGDLQAQLEGSINGVGVKMIPVGYLLEAPDGSRVDVSVRRVGTATVTVTRAAPHADQSDIARARRRKAGRCPTHDLEPTRWGAGANAETMRCYQIYRCPCAGCDYEVMR